MVIIKIMGGLGNQMFQAALYKSMEIEGKEVKADLTHIQKYGNIHNGYELKRIFGLNLVEASENEINKYADLQLRQAELSEFKATLVYSVSYRTANHT